MAAVYDTRDWRIVSCILQQPGSRTPKRSYEWALASDRLVVLVVFEIHKFYVELPKVVAFVDSINWVVASARLAGTERNPDAAAVSPPTH